MLKEMYKTGYNWCLKYGKGAILVLSVYLFLEIAKKLIKKYFGVDIDAIALPEHFGLYGAIGFCFMLLIQSWVNLEFLNYIYKGETGQKYYFVVFDKVRPYIMPVFIGSFILNLIMILPVILMVMSSEMGSLSEGYEKSLWVILTLVFLLFVFPLVIVFLLRLSFYIEVIIINSIKDPVLALKESFKITKGRVWDIIRVLVLPMVLAAIVVAILTNIIQKTGCSFCDFMGFAGAIIQPLLAAVSLALYLEFRKNPIKKSNGEARTEKE